MLLPEKLIDEDSLPNREHPHFIRVFRSVQNASGILISPSDSLEALRTYERMGLLQACVDSLLCEIHKKISEDFESGIFPSNPKIHLEDGTRYFFKSEGFEEGSQALLPNELELVIDEIITQVEAQGIAGFDSILNDITGTTMSFMRA